MARLHLTTIILTLSLLGLFSIVHQANASTTFRVTIEVESLPDGSMPPSTTFNVGINGLYVAYAGYSFSCSNLSQPPSWPVLDAIPPTPPPFDFEASISAGGQYDIELDTLERHRVPSLDYSCRPPYAPPPPQGTTGYFGYVRNARVFSGVAPADYATWVSTGGSCLFPNGIQYFPGNEIGDGTVVTCTYAFRYVPPSTLRIIVNQEGELARGTGNHPYKISTSVDRPYQQFPFFGANPHEAGIEVSGGEGTTDIALVGGSYYGVTIQVGKDVTLSSPSIPDAGNNWAYGPPDCNFEHQVGISGDTKRSIVSFTVNPNPNLEMTCTFTSRATTPPPVGGNLKIVTKTIGGDGRFDYKLGRMPYFKYSPPYSFEASYGYQDVSTTDGIGEKIIEVAAMGNVVRGVHTLTQVPPNGWIQSFASCDDGTSIVMPNSPTYPTAYYPLCISQNYPYGCVSDNHASREIALKNVLVRPGETTTCTFTNIKASSPGWLKIKVNTSGGNDTFGFLIGPTPSSTEVTTYENTGESHLIELPPNTLYTIKEIVPDGWLSSGGYCNIAGTNTYNDQNIDEELYRQYKYNFSESVLIVAGQTTTCTFGNQRPSAPPPAPQTPPSRGGRPAPQEEEIPPREEREPVY